MADWTPNRVGIARTVIRRQTVRASRWPDGRATLSITEEGTVPVVLDLDPAAAQRIGRILLGLPDA